MSSAVANSRLVHPSPFCSMNVYLSVGCNASRALVANSFVRYCRSGSACKSLRSWFVSWPSRVRSPSAQAAASSGRRLRNIISASFTVMRISQVENCDFPSNCWILLKALQNTFCTLSSASSRFFRIRKDIPSIRCECRRTSSPKALRFPARALAISAFSDSVIWLFITAASPVLVACSNSASVATRYTTLEKHGQYDPRCMELNKTSYPRRSASPSHPEDVGRSAKNRARQPSPRPDFLNLRQLWLQLRRGLLQAPHKTSLFA
jgi:hypothetical protein